MNNYQEYIENGDTEKLNELIGICNQAQLDEMLNYSCMIGNKTITELLLKNNANPNVILGTSMSSLHTAVMFSNHILIEFLLNYNADINIQDKNGDTPLHIAANIDHASMLALLIEKADLNIINKRKKTPLDHAIRNGSAYNVAELIAAGANSSRPFCFAFLQYVIRLTKDFWNSIRVYFLYRVIKKK